MNTLFTSREGYFFYLFFPRTHRDDVRRISAFFYVKEGHSSGRFLALNVRLDGTSRGCCGGPSSSCTLSPSSPAQGELTVGPLKIATARQVSIV